MPRLKLSQDFVDGLSVKDRPKETYYDTVVPGFGVYVCRDTPSGPGKRTYFIRYTDDTGRQRGPFTVADARITKLKAGRDAALLLLGRGKGGSDLKAEKDAKRKAAAESRERTLQWVVDRYRESPARNDKRPRTVATEDQRLDTLVLPILGTTPVKEIGMADVETMMEKVWGDRTPLRAGHARDALRTVLEYALRKGWVEFNAAKQVKPDARTQSGRRQRALSDREIAAVWNAPAGSLVRDALRLALLCTTRAGETIMAEWSEFDLDGRTWVVPPEHTKKGRPHIVYLSDPAVALMRRLREDAEADLKERLNNDLEAKLLPWVFPNRARTSHIAPDKMTQVCHRIGTDLGLKAGGWFSAHDFRRTATTRLAEMGIANAESVLSRMLSHVSTEGSRSLPHYLQYGWAKEIRAALELWSGEVIRIAEGRPALAANENVHSLANARAQKVSAEASA